MRGLGQMLVLTGAARAEDVTAAVSAVGDGDALPGYLLRRGLVNEVQLAEAVSVATSTPYVDLSTYPLDPTVIALVPGGQLCRRYRMIPLRHNRDQLTVAMVDPTDIIALDDVASLTDLRVTPVVVTDEALNQAFERYLRSDEELTDLSEQIGEASGASNVVFTEQLDDQDADAPVVRFVNLLITQAINDRASDIHIEPGEHRLTVRFRIDGVLHEMQRADRSIQDGVISRLKIMSSIDIAEKRVPQDGRISVLHEGRSVDLRVATLPTVWGEKIVMRILDNSGQVMLMSDLLFSERNEERFTQAISRPHGMVLVTGADRIRQVHDPVHGAAGGREPARQRHHRRGSGRVPDPGHQQIQVNPPAPGSPSPQRCGRSCARIRTWCSSARSATGRPRRSRSRPH